MNANLFENSGLASAGWSCKNEAGLSVQTASYCRNLFHHHHHHDRYCGDGDNDVS